MNEVWLSPCHSPEDEKRKERQWGLLLTFQRRRGKKGSQEK
jgi:hypothetical protein